MKNKTNILSLVLSVMLSGCGSSSKVQCSLNNEHHFGFEECQLYSMPPIDMEFHTGDQWVVKTAELARQNFYYFEAARLNDDSTGSVLLRMRHFKRVGSYIGVDEQLSATMQHSLSLQTRDSWITESTDSVDGFFVRYGRYEQEPERPYVFAHHLILPDSTENGILLELLMPCEANNFGIKKEQCLEEIISTIHIH